MLQFVRTGYQKQALQVIQINPNNGMIKMHESLSLRESWELDSK